MMVRFNSAKYKDETPGKGFSVQVESLESGNVISLEVPVQDYELIVTVKAEVKYWLLNV